MELLLVYVDDLFFMSPSPMSRDQFKVDLQTDFKLNENKSQSSHKFSAETPSILNIGMIRDWENDTLIVHHANFIEHMAKKKSIWIRAQKLYCRCHQLLYSERQLQIKSSKTQSSETWWVH